MATAMWIHSNPVVDHILGLSVHACAQPYNALVRHYLTAGRGGNEAILIGIELQQSKRPIEVYSWPGINACRRTHIALISPGRSWDEILFLLL